MKTRLIIICILLATVAWFVLGDNFLTSQHVTVFVNDVDIADGAKCVWTGNHYFDITITNINARVYVLPYKAGAQSHLMGVSVRFTERLPMPDSIMFRLIHKNANGDERDVQLAPRLPSPQFEQMENGWDRAWHRQYRITEDLSKLPEGSVKLLWSMDYRDDNGKITPLLITVPLRKAEVTIPTSLVICYNRASRWIAQAQIAGAGSEIVM